MKRKEPPQPQKKKSWPYAYAPPTECYICGVLAENKYILPMGVCEGCFQAVYGELPQWMRMCGNGKKNGHKKG